jgi:hypothetical protein
MLVPLANGASTWKDVGLFDYKAILKHLERENSWKSTPKIASLVKYGSLYKQLFAICPSGVLLHSTVKAAFIAMDLDGPKFLNTQVGTKEDVATSLSNILRMGASKYRTLKMCSKARQIVFERASPLEQATIAEVLDVLSIAESLDTSPPVIKTKPGPAEDELKQETSPDSYVSNQTVTPNRVQDPRDVRVSCGGLPLKAEGPGGRVGKSY